MSEAKTISLLECEERAKDEGYNSASFWALFPKGLTRCTWLDAYFGLFQIDGIEGFVTTRDMRQRFPDLECFWIGVAPKEECA